MSTQSKATRQQPSTFAITKFQNGYTVDAQSRTPKARVKRYIHRNPGARIEAIMAETHLTERAVNSCLERLVQDDEIYSTNDGPFRQWRVGSKRAIPDAVHQGFNSVFQFAERVSSGLAGFRI